MVCGLAWAASLRAVMAQFAGNGKSQFEWMGTYEGILLPGAVVGGLLGWAAYRHGRTPSWLVMAPLLFVVATPTVVASVFVDGLGGGALAVPLVGMAGGYALAGRGLRWTRWAAAVVALLAVPGWLVMATMIGGPLALDTPLGSLGRRPLPVPAGGALVRLHAPCIVLSPSSSRHGDGWCSWASSAAWRGVRGCGGSWRRPQTPCRR